MASGDDDGSIKLWRPDQRQETYLFTHLSAAVFGVAFSPDGKTLAAGTADLFQPRKAGEIKLWDVASRELRSLKGHNGGIGSVAYSPGGDRIASASADGTVRIWDVASGAESCLRSQGRGVPAPSGVPMGGGSLHAVANYSFPCAPGEIKLWDAETGAEKYSLRDHQAAVGSLAFSPDGQWLASGSGDKTVKIRDAATGQAVRTLAGLGQGVFVLAYSRTESGSPWAAAPCCSPPNPAT